MNILWVTPFSKTSAIGRFSRLVTNALVEQGVATTIASCEALTIDRKQAHPTTLPLILDKNEVMDRLNDFDLVVFNVGNHYTYHGALIDYMNRRAGIHIMHDFYLYDLYHGWMSAHGTRREHDDTLRNIYGPDVQLDVPEGLSSEQIFQHRVRHFPVLDWIAPRSLGCVNHAKFGLPLLQAVTAGPIVHIPLAFDAPALGKIAAPIEPGGRLRVASFGDVNPNKRVESVVRAIGASKYLRDAICYTVVGRASEDEKTRLTSIAKALGVELELIGYASPEVYAAHMQRADIVCCLRYPTTESASATTIESMLLGRPTLVTDVGFYKDLPDDMVLKIDPLREQETLVAALERMMAQPERRSMIGQEARRWARKNFSPANYASQFIAFAGRVLDTEPALRTANTIADLASTLKLPSDDQAVTRWCELSQAMFAAAG